MPKSIILFEMPPSNPSARNAGMKRMHSTDGPPFIKEELGATNVHRNIVEMKPNIFAPPSPCFNI
jgi:hypothetical protein